MQTGAMQLTIDIFNNSTTPEQHQLKTDIQIKSVCVTRVGHSLSAVLVIVDLKVKRVVI